MAECRIHGCAYKLAGSLATSRGLAFAIGESVAVQVRRICSYGILEATLEHEWN